MMWQRVVLYQEAEKLLKPLETHKLDAFEVAGNGFFWPQLKFKSYHTAYLPQYDACRDLAPFGPYDLVIMDQVLEHIRYPVAALKMARDSLRTGGHIFVATPFLVRNHPSPDDYWRWTEQGMCCLLEDNGFTDIKNGSWGNAACIAANLKEWTEYQPGIHSLENEQDCPVHVWALARKA